MRSRRRPGRLAGAAVAVTALVLTGCAQNPPGVAAEVGDATITDAQVDELADALCILNEKAEEPQPLTSQQTRSQALQILLDNELAADIIDPEAVDKDQVDAAREQAAQSTEKALPARLRDTFDETVGAFATTQLGLAELGRRSLVDQGTQAPDQQAALAEGQRLLVEHSEETRVSVDPRFGTLADGRLGPADGSLSVAVSDEAKASSDGGTGTDLPANLSCTAG